jgi:hypothetical protein
MSSVGTPSVLAKSANRLMSEQNAAILIDVEITASLFNNLRSPCNVQLGRAVLKQFRKEVRI